MDPREGWLGPDARGLHTLTEGFGQTATRRGRRRLRASGLDLQAAGHWPSDYRALAVEWLSGSPNPAWRTLRTLAGAQRTALAEEVLDAMLLAGWIELVQQRDGSQWTTARVHFLELEACREALGLVHRGKQAELRGALPTTFDDPRLQAAAQDLEMLPDALALRRHALLAELQRWIDNRDAGTRRDFAYFATGDSKGIAAADWQWLTERLDLESLGIDAHVPTLLLRAPIVLRGAGHALDLRGLPDWLGLPPAVIHGTQTTDGSIGAWRLVENRGSFQHASRHWGERDAVIWMPGQPPGWWLACLERLLNVLPAAAYIAADPDPAGIHIAARAGQLWDQRGLSWSPWKMSPEHLAALPRTRPLSDADWQQLDTLDKMPLHPQLARLAAAMRASGQKGEQEGLFFRPIGLDD